MAGLEPASPIRIYHDMLHRPLGVPGGRTFFHKSTENLWLVVSFLLARKPAFEMNKVADARSTERPLQSTSSPTSVPNGSVVRTVIPEALRKQFRIISKARKPIATRIRDKVPPRLP